MANKRWGTNDYTEAATLAAADQSGIVQAGVLKYFKLSTLLAWLSTRAIGSAVNALSIAAGTVTIDLALGDYFTLALTANVTSIVFTNLPVSGVGRTIMIRFQQDGTGGRTVTLPSSFKGVTGSDAAVQGGANARTILALTSFDQGTRWEYSMKALAA
jgi:hypothetical protein